MQPSIPSIDFSKAVRFRNGVRVLNVTPHPLTFLDGEETVTVQPCGAIVNARLESECVGARGPATFVRLSVWGSAEGLRALATIAAHAPGVIAVGSLLAAQAYPGRVVSAIPADGYGRGSNMEKRMRTDRFTVFPGGVGLPPSRQQVIPLTPSSAIRSLAASAARAEGT